MSVGSPLALGDPLGLRGKYRGRSRDAERCKVRRRPDTLVHLYVSDVDAVVAEFGRLDGEPPYECELELRDLNGNRLRISRLVSGATIAIVSCRLPQPKFGELTPHLTGVPGLSPGMAP